MATRTRHRPQNAAASNATRYCPHLRIGAGRAQRARYAGGTERRLVAAWAEAWIKSGGLGKLPFGGLGLAKSSQR